MCSVLEVSRSGFYSWLRRKESHRSRENGELTQQIKGIHTGHHRAYGAPRVHAELVARGKKCGKNRVARLMNVNGIRSRVRKKFKVTTNSAHKRPIAPNLLKDRSFPTELNEVWVSDITYIWTREGWSYLASVMDLASRTVVGWSMGANMKTGLVIAALDMAIQSRCPSSGLIHHSDRGSQYASKAYRDMLKDHGMQCSMSGKGNCYDNAFKESFFHSFKTELSQHEDYQTREQARLSAFDYIEVFYNRDRRHSSLGYMSPLEFEQQLSIRVA